MVKRCFIISKDKKGMELMNLLVWLVVAIVFLIITGSVIYIIKKRIFG